MIYNDRNNRGSTMIPLQFDEDLFQVTIAGSSILLLPKEFALFRFLYHHDQVFSREALLDLIWPLEEPAVSGSHQISVSSVL